MAVTSTLPITFTDLYNEFGGDANSITLSDYLRGGGLVPDIPENSDVPTSLPISLSDLLGATAEIPNVVVNITGTFNYDSNDSDLLEHGYIVKPNGEIHYWELTSTPTGVSEESGYTAQWTDDAPIDSSLGADFEVSFSFGDPNMTGDNGALTEDRQVTTTSDSSSLGITVREISNTNNEDTQAFTLENSA